ncbi:hypothetical protein RclHR1_00340004 [Rhizophagus clarus]|uniref:Uncharacterized protein n=1 Tax=Rhizophagus clarus TaxID=94130 RepID=A0A2Z6RA64_9GLOM|nr:hypothetical protein RclHR1_00340004 [Rhizophagus clarus]
MHDIKKAIIKEDVIIENSRKQELNVTLNNSESQGELSPCFIKNFDKIKIKEIDPVTFSYKREKFSFEKGFDMRVDGVNDLIFKLANKGTSWQLIEENVIEYFNNYNVNLKEIYNWLLNNPNNLNSIFLLGYFNYRGIETNVDLKKAFNLFNASKENHILSQYFVGNCYEFGNGTTKNEKLAFEYFEKSAKKNFSHGQLEIGYFYDCEIGVKRDLIKAFYWYKKAANNGNIIAMYNLGRYYLNGIVIEKDCKKAFELFKKSAEGGYSNGIMMLGYSYEMGIGTKKDKQKAFESYQNAANFGEKVAQYNLALMYEKGNGVTKDKDKAIYWYEKSAKQGYHSAQDKLEMFQNNL